MLQKQNWKKLARKQNSSNSSSQCERLVLFGIQPFAVLMTAKMKVLLETLKIHVAMIFV
jgi:hypothetical protein